MITEFKKLHVEAKPPTRATDGSAGLDLYSVEAKMIEGRSRCWVCTGWALVLPEGQAGFVWPRSGWADKYGIDTMAGLIDPDYRGELRVLLYNTEDTRIFIDPGDRIAQLVIQPYSKVQVVVVENLPDTERGEKGFGSSGL